MADLKEENNDDWKKRLRLSILRSTSSLHAAWMRVLNLMSAVLFSPNDLFVWSRQTIIS